MNEQRDPRIDPQPGDMLRKDGRTLMVHYVKEGWVYLGNIGGVKIPIQTFREEVKSRDIEVLPC